MWNNDQLTRFRRQTSFAEKNHHEDESTWRPLWVSSSSPSLGRYADDLPNWCSMKVSAVVAPLNSKTKRPFLLAGLWDDEDVVAFV